MKRFRYIPQLVLLACALTVSAAAQRGEGPIDPAPPKGVPVEQIIQRFAAKEKEFAEARERYTYRQSVKVQTLEAGSVDGEYQQVVEIAFDDRGRRVENVVFAPQSTLQRIDMTREDFQDIEKLYPFVLTSDEIGLYDISYVGQQKVDELNTYVFDVKPKKIEKDKRYFEGRIWVDDRDLQIVKTLGKPVFIRKDEQQFPSYVTYREQVDGRYWFPTYTRANEVLQFKNGDVPIRITVRYENYRRFGSDVKIIYEGEELKREPESKDKKPPQQTPEPPK